jgi:hypothetical protein
MTSTPGWPPPGRTPLAQTSKSRHALLVNGVLTCPKHADAFVEPVGRSGSRYKCSRGCTLKPPEPDDGRPGPTPAPGQ